MSEWMYLLGYQIPDCKSTVATPLPILGYDAHSSCSTHTTAHTQTMSSATENMQSLDHM